MHRLLFFTICIILSSPAPADSFRCGRSLVKVGDSANTLIKKCGNPARKYSSKENINIQGRKVRKGVSNWVFPRKNGKDMIVSVFSGKVVRMQLD